MGRQNKELIENINKLNEMTEITQEQFEAYVDVQESGVTNMFDVKTVSQLSGLEKEEGEVVGLEFEDNNVNVIIKDNGETEQ